MPQLHICQIFSHTGINGVTTSGRMLIEGLLEKGHRVTVLHRPNAWIAEHAFRGDINTRSIHMGVRLLNYAQIYRIYKKLSREGIDVIHSHGDVASRITGLINMFGSTPSLATRHNMAFHPHWRVQNAVIAPSRATAQELRRQHLVSQRRLHVVPNFIDLNTSHYNLNSTAKADLRRELALSENAFCLVVIGDISRRKNQSAIPALISQLHQMGVNAEVAMIGSECSDEVEKVKANASKLGVSPYIKLLGKRDNVRKLLPAFDAYISTSYQEQASIALLEALAAGLPAFCTPAGSAPEILGETQAGALLDLNRPAPALLMMKRLATDAAFADQVSTNCVDLIKTPIPAIKSLAKLRLFTLISRAQRTGTSSRARDARDALLDYLP